MKSLIFLIIASGLMLFTNQTYSQEKDCTGNTCTKEVSCCQSSCSHEEHGKAGADSNVTVTDNVCPVAGETIPQGQGVEFTYYGKKYTFCCEGCLGKFKNEPAKYIKDELVCPVMSDPIDVNSFLIHDGVKYYFCCDSCLGKFEKNPQKYIDKMNKKEEK